MVLTAMPVELKSCLWFDIVCPDAQPPEAKTRMDAMFAATAFTLEEAPPGSSPSARLKKTSRPTSEAEAVSEVKMVKDEVKKVKDEPGPSLLSASASASASEGAGRKLNLGTARRAMRSAGVDYLS